jgi:hypothetical protein
MRDNFSAHLGGESALTPLQRVLVERAAMLQLRCAVLDHKILHGTFNGYDANSYLAFVNALRRTIALLELKPEKTPAPPPSLASIAADIARRPNGA